MALKRGAERGKRRWSEGAIFRVGIEETREQLRPERRLPVATKLFDLRELACLGACDVQWLREEQLMDRVGNPNIVDLKAGGHGE